MTGSFTSKTNILSNVCLLQQQTSPNFSPTQNKVSAGRRRAITVKPERSLRFRWLPDKKNIAVLLVSKTGEEPLLYEKVASYTRSGSKQMSRFLQLMRVVFPQIR